MLSLFEKILIYANVTKTIFEKMNAPAKIFVDFKQALFSRLVDGRTEKVVIVVNVDVEAPVSGNLRFRNFDLIIGGGEVVSGPVQVGLRPKTTSVEILRETLTKFIIIMLLKRFRC